MLTHEKIFSDRYYEKNMIQYIEKVVRICDVSFLLKFVVVLCRLSGAFSFVELQTVPPLIFVLFVFRINMLIHSA